MLTSRIIPCLDVSDNRVVKGVKFQGLRDVGSPAELAARYEQQGADEIVVLDVTATNRNQNTQLVTVREVRDALSIPLTVGGGVRTIEDVERLISAGADKVSVNSAAVERPELIREIAERFGSQCTVVAVDARQTNAGWEVLTRAGKQETGLCATEWSVRAEELGAGEILQTSFDRDGTRSGYDCQLLRSVTSQINIPVIASGGADNSDHLFEGLEAGASAVLLASILHDGLTTVAKLKTELISLGACIRP